MANLRYLDNPYIGEDADVDFLVRAGTFAGLTVLDVLFSTAGGAAAAAAGAHAEGVAITSTILSIGAKAGATKAGILFLAGLSGFANLNFALWVLVMLTLNSFAAAIIVAVQVSQEALGSISKALIIAAVVAVIPGSAEFIGSVPIVFCNEIFSVLFIPGFDALAGYVFARMAHNEGLDICEWNTGAIAGVVYGCVTLFHHLVATIVRSFHNRGRASEQFE